MKNYFIWIVGCIWKYLRLHICYVSPTEMLLIYFSHLVASTFFMSFTVESPSVAVVVNVFLIPIVLDFRILCICYISMPPVSCFGYLSLTNFLLLLQISNEKVMILFEKSIVLNRFLSTS